jgi:hypothetical protein
LISCSSWPPVEHAQATVGRAASTGRRRSGWWSRTEERWADVGLPDVHHAQPEKLVLAAVGGPWSCSASPTGENDGREAATRSQLDRQERRRLAATTAPVAAMVA